MNLCKCGIRDWGWEIDSRLRSWIRCKACGGSMFDDGVGVILINWDFTDINDINIEDVLRSNIQNKGIVISEKNNNNKP